MPKTTPNESTADPRVSAIQLDPPRIEYHKPDLGLAYSVLAPKVAEAWAFLKAGKIPAATKALDEAKEVVDVAAMQAASITIADAPSR